ncbi:MAG TPA: hypothetical protein HA302_03525 [Thermococcaceae archaeon]|uniref:Uncharacterized protein n=1 Tax=Thermococcus sibiricus TaxID=172049 RepID=A0A101ELJ8_9EURY|nr:hypothetical protein [Thermococcus sibiricus]KUK17613.1 MAG: Uncharacterized protein XD54_1125 [Thermococcus sibiricus]KUK28104.1 MAG: Uncharacterized protein XD61_1353 [Thermococcus sp. 40_45]HII67080.1 hypothetical protein [Thermococcaceae archaeon]
MLWILIQIMLILAFPVFAFVTLGWGADFLMLIVIYAQLLVIWRQAEIYERQNLLLLNQFEPSFSVRINDNMLIIENVSQNPAYDVGIGRVLLRWGEPIPPEKWREYISFPEEYPIQCLSPKESGTLGYFINETYFFGKKIEVLYRTRLGEIRSFS